MFFFTSTSVTITMLLLTLVSPLFHLVFTGLPTPLEQSLLLLPSSISTYLFASLLLVNRHYDTIGFWTVWCLLCVALHVGMEKFILAIHMYCAITSHHLASHRIVSPPQMAFVTMVIVLTTIPMTYFSTKYLAVALH